MAEIPHPASPIDMLERALENVQAEDLQFPRPFVYIAASLLAWVAFWELADRNQHNPHSQTMAWLFVFVAVYVAYTY